MTYREELALANASLAKHEASRFVGYGLKHGRAAGTLSDVPEEKIIETPVAENLVIGLATGLSLAGLRPVAFIERMDFILNSLDAIVNHLDKIHALSHGEFSPAVIIRTMVGNKERPLFTGLCHVQDHSTAIAKMVSFPVIRLRKAEEIKFAYEEAARDQMKGVSTLLVEYRDLL